MTIRTFLDHHPYLGSNIFIDPTALVIGDVHIDDDSSIWPMTVLRGDVNTITIGARTNIQDGSVLHVTHAGPFTAQGFALQIGDDVTVGHRVTLHGCTIKSHCLIGMSATVMDNVVIESYVMLGAGSLVPPGKILESGYLWVGSPAKKIRMLTQEELNFIDYSAKHYVTLKNKYIKNSSCSQKQ